MSTPYARVAGNCLAPQDLETVSCEVCGSKFDIPRKRNMLFRGMDLRIHLNKHVKAGELKDSERARIVKELQA